MSSVLLHARLTPHKGKGADLVYSRPGAERETETLATGKEAQRVATKEQRGSSKSCGEAERVATKEERVGTKEVGTKELPLEAYDETHLWLRQMRH